jgi:hypothetical protein
MKWMNRHRSIADGRMDLLRFEQQTPEKENPEKMKTDEGLESNQKKVKTTSQQNDHRKVIADLTRQMSRLGYYFAHMADLTSLEFWKHVYKNIIFKKKQLALFCRDGLTSSEYFNFRKIIALYPSVRVVEIRNCAHFNGSSKKEKTVEAITKLLNEMFSVDTQTWSPELARFMLTSYTKILQNMWSGENQKVHLMNFEHVYRTSFSKKQLGSVQRFRSKFKAKSRPVVMNLTPSILRRIMHKSHPAVFLFLDGNELPKERRAMIRSFRQTSKMVRFDKNMYFVIIGGNKFFYTSF